MSRKGYWRQIQKEAGSRTRRQTDKKKREQSESTAERKEGEAERWRQYHICGCMLSSSQISILKGLNGVYKMLE